MDLLRTFICTWTLLQTYSLIPLNIWKLTVNTQAHGGGCNWFACILVSECTPLHQEVHRYSCLPSLWPHASLYMFLLHLMSGENAQNLLVRASRFAVCLHFYVFSMFYGTVNSIYAVEWTKQTILRCHLSFCEIVSGIFLDFSDILLTLWHLHFLSSLFLLLWVPLLFFLWLCGLQLMKSVGQLDYRVFVCSYS